MCIASLTAACGRVKRADIPTAISFHPQLQYRLSSHKIGAGKARPPGRIRRFIQPLSGIGGRDLTCYHHPSPGVSVLVCKPRRKRDGIIGANGKRQGMRHVLPNWAQVKHRLVERMLEGSYEEIRTRIDLNCHLPTCQQFSKTLLYLYQQLAIRLSWNLDNFVS